MSILPRILLITGTPPGAKIAGGVFLQELTKIYPPGKLLCYTTSLNIGISEIAEPKIATLMGRKPTTGISALAIAGINRYFTVFTGIDKILNAWLYQYNYLKRLAQSYKPDLIWGVLNHIEAITLCWPIAKSLKIPLVTMIWDPPERFQEKGYFTGPIIYQLVKKSFDQAITNSFRCAVSSDAMGKKYQSKYGIECKSLIHALPRSLRTKPDFNRTKGKEYYTIVLAGAPHGKSSLELLTLALININWTVAGKPIVLKLIGYEKPEDFPDYKNVQWLGWKPLDEVIKITSECDLAYLSNSFEESFIYSVQECFPNKLSAYLAAGVPVLYCGPPDAAVCEFLRKYEFSVSCTVPDAENLAKIIANTLQDEEVNRKRAMATQAPLEQELNLRVFYERFAWLIGVDPKDLNIPQNP